MKKTKLIIILIAVLVVIAIGIVITIIYLNKQSGDIGEDESGVAYNVSDLNNFEFEIVELDNNIKAKITNMDEFYIKFKEYIYLNGLVQANKATYVSHEENLENSVVIKFNLNNSKKTIVYAYVNFETNQYIFYENRAVTDNNKFYIVERSISKYLSYVNLNPKEPANPETNQESLAMIYKITTEEAKMQAIYDVLDKDYINKNSVTSQNVYNYVAKSTKSVTFEAIKMNKLSDIGTNLEVYSIYGKETNIENLEVSYKYYIAKLDTNNTTFSIVPLNSNNYKNINEIQIENSIKEIEKNERNGYIIINLKEADMAIKYFQNYKELAINNPSEAYEKLDKEYREKRFGSVEAYKEYIENNLTEITNRNIFQYTATQESAYTEYVCKDQYGNVYIFKVTAVMEYSAILDTYTLNLPEFTAKYDQATEQGKVALNIQKFIDSLNYKDYKYAYNKLSTGFKSNYFKTEQSFKDYIEDKLYKNCVVKYMKFELDSGLYKYTIQLTDADNENSKIIEKTIIMQLKENREFELSFDV